MAVMTPTILSKTGSRMIQPGVYVRISDPPEWLLDRSLLKLLYDKVHWYRAKGKPTKKKRVEYISATPPFEHYTACQVTSIDLGAFNRPTQIGFHISFGFLETIHGSSEMYLRVDEQLCVLSGIPTSIRAGYDGSSLVSRYWHKLRVLFVKMRPIAMYWLEQTVKRTMQSEFTEPGNIYSSGIPIGAGAISEQQCFEEMDMH